MSSPTHQAPTIHNQAINPQGMLGTRLTFEYERMRNKTAFWGLGCRGMAVHCQAGAGSARREKAHMHNRHTHAHLQRGTHTKTCIHTDVHTCKHTHTPVPHTHTQTQVYLVSLPQVHSNGKKTTTVDIYQIWSPDDIQSTMSDVQEIF